MRATRPTASVSRALLAEAFLASEYGRPAALESEEWADELATTTSPGEVPEDLQAARVLFRVARGDRQSGVVVARATGLVSRTPGWPGSPGRACSRAVGIIGARWRI